MSAKKMKAIELAKIDVIDGATSAFLKDLDKALGRLNTSMVRYMADLEGGERLATSGRNLNRAVNAAAQIEEMLLESGYRDSTERLVASYDRVAKLSRASLAAGGISDTFSAVDVRALTALKDMDLSRWQAVGDDLVRQIHSSILDAVVSGSTVRSMQDNIERQLRGLGEDEATIVGRSKTLANTLSHSFDRSVTNRQAQTAGIDTFIYLGPDDSITRPFCSAMLSGKGDGEFNIPAVDGDPPVYTSEDIAGMDNGQGLPVDSFAGGYNCRHGFRPISVKVAEEVLA